MRRGGGTGGRASSQQQPSSSSLRSRPTEEGEEDGGGSSNSTIRRSRRIPVPSSRYQARDYQTFLPPSLLSSTARRRQDPQSQQQPVDSRLEASSRRRETLPTAGASASASSFAFPQRRRPERQLDRRETLTAGGATVQNFGRPSERSAGRLAAVHRPENRPEFQERGQTRSGARFAARNLPYFSSIAQLLSHHQRLLEPGPVVSTRYVHVGRGSVLQTCIRYRSDYSDIRGSLTRILTDLLQELNFDDEGFEISITFNAILSNRDSTSFSLFFGQNYGQGSPQSRLGLAERPVVVRNPLHIRRVPTEFNLEDLVQRYSLAFDSSDLVVARILNVVYLVHQYRAGGREESL